MVNQGVHITISGLYERCRRAPESCEHLHLPGVTGIREAKALPAPFLEQLLDVIEPGGHTVNLVLGDKLEDPLGAGTWHVQAPTRIWYNSRGYRHRAYGLPAVVGEDGLRIWYWGGRLHRERGLPAIINPEAKLKAWLEHGKLHRADGKPAILSGQVHSWYEYGERTRASEMVDARRNFSFRLYDTDPRVMRMNLYGRDTEVF